MKFALQSCISNLLIIEIFFIIILIQARIITLSYNSLVLYISDISLHNNPTISVKFKRLSFGKYHDYDYNEAFWFDFSLPIS